MDNKEFAKAMKEKFNADVNKKKPISINDMTEVMTNGLLHGKIKPSELIPFSTFGSMLIHELFDEEGKEKE